MDKSNQDMDKQEKRINELAEDIDPQDNAVPDSVAEATTVPLSDKALGGNAAQSDTDK